MSLDSILILHIIMILLAILFYSKDRFFYHMYHTVRKENINDITFHEMVELYMTGLIFLLTLVSMLSSLGSAYGIGIMIMMILKHIPELEKELKNNER